LPPKGFTFGGGISCVTLECWACITGLSEVINLIPSSKRAVLQSTSSTNSTVGGLAADFSSVDNSQCTHYICTDGLWNDNVCACVCNDINSIWTPQYGCYNAQDYENGQAPPGANPNANPNNPNYDPTVDPYSPQYQPSKDPNPYYNPYEIVKTTPSFGYAMVPVYLFFLLSILF